MAWGEALALAKWWREANTGSLCTSSQGEVLTLTWSENQGDGSAAAGRRAEGEMRTGRDTRPSCHAQGLSLVIPVVRKAREAPAGLAVESAGLKGKELVGEQ